MATSEKLPWASGPGEILRHGLSLLRTDSDTNRRLAMISIDNAVELMIKTYLGLPKRVTGLTITRKQYTEVSESFPALLDALEQYAPDRLTGIDLGTIEWYHRLRNELYHQGNGLTVERDKVEVYAELANVLFQNLFGVPLVPHVLAPSDLLGDFIQQWVSLERSLNALAERERLKSGRPGPSPRTVLEAVRFLRESRLFSDTEVAEIESFRRIRNEVLHGGADHRALITPAIVARIKEFTSRFPEAAEEIGKPFTTPQ